MADLTLAEVQSALLAKGYCWHSFQKSAIGKDGVKRYLFNGSMLGVGRGRLNKQPFGWYTLQEMMDEKFAEGCR